MYVFETRCEVDCAHIVPSFEICMLFLLTVGP